MSLVVAVQAPVVLRPAWIKSDQTAFLGIRHKRTPIPYVITPQTLLRYRSTTVGENLTMRLLNFNSATETVYNVTQSWQISANHAEGVLFVDSVEHGEHVVETELGGSLIPLPVFVLGETDENVFKSLLGDSRFAWVDLRVVSLLIPPDSINTLKNTSFLTLYNFYRNIIAFYDAFTGLVDDPTMFSVNSNTNKQFFIKADSSGGQDAYYNSNWLAMCRTDLGNFLIPTLPSNWLVLHCMAEAYNYGFTKYHTRLQNVWSGMLGDRLQYYWQNKNERQTLSKIYENGQRIVIEKEILELIQTNVNLDFWSNQHKMVFFSWILNHDSKVIADMCKSFRHRNTLNVKQPHHWVWLASLSKFNLIPLLYLCGATPALYMYIDNDSNTNTVPSLDYIIPHHLTLSQFINHKKCLYPINQLKNNFNLNNNLSKEYVESDFTLFTPLTSRQFKININLTLTIQIHDMAEIAGDTITIYDGLDVVAVKSVPKDGIIVLDSITPGVYMVQHPRGRNYFYSVCYGENAVNEPYLIITDNTSNVFVRYNRRLSSDFNDEEAILLGENQVIVGVMFVNGPERFVYIHLNSTECNPNEPQTVYHDITFVHGNNNTQAQLLMHGDRSNLSHGWHKFSNVTQLIVNSKSCIFLDTVLPAQPVRFALTDTGVMLDIDLSLTFPDAVQRIRARIDRHCKWLDNNPTALILENDVRDNIYLATKDMETARYDRYYPDRVRRVAANYDFMFAGASYKNYLKLSIRLLENLGTLVVENGTLNTNFDTIYAGVQIQNAGGDILLRSMFRGDETIVTSHNDFPLCEDYTIQLYHREPNKLSVYKNFQIVPNFNNNQQNTFLKVTNGLLVVTNGPHLTTN
ncbi:enhancin-4 [Mocis latipes granulovirus]|uniref:Enhancin-4 n=1 Tax=Mocis latipes granulovirus TaxID=2072024 RepID=A0A162GX58_9BBAC|nr:enhancin-4 [Mocis latipes granulovirus]AKR17537.1 enhancin-4 [Mocis latipes granulovirus]